MAEQRTCRFSNEILQMIYRNCDLETRSVLEQTSTAFRHYKHKNKDVVKAYKKMKSNLILQRPQHTVNRRNTHIVMFPIGKRFILRRRYGNNRPVWERMMRVSSTGTATYM